MQVRHGILMVAATLTGSAPSAGAGPSEDEFVTSALEITAGAPSTCPGWAGLASEVRARLQRPAIVAGDADLSLTVTYVADAAGVTARVRLRTREGLEVGTRELRLAGADCASFGESLPLVLALMIDLRRAELPRATAPQAPPSSASSSAAPPRDAQPPRSPLHVAAPREAAPPTDVLLRALTAVSVGRSPRPALGGWLGVEISFYGSARAGVELGGWRPTQTTGRPGARLSLVEAGFTSCSPALPLGPAELRGCGALRAGRATWEGVGWLRSRAAARLSAGVVTGPNLELALTDTFGLELATRGGLALTRERVIGVTTTGEETVVWEPPPVWGELGLGLTARFR